MKDAVLPQSMPKCVGIRSNNMAHLKIHIDRIIENIEILNDFMKKYHKEWSLVVKVLGNDKNVLSPILKHPVIRELHSIAVTHPETLKLIKQLDSEIKTMYIKPPALRNADKIVRFADYSFNTSIATIKALNDAAAKLNIEHNIIIMMEMGELREGIKREGLIPFYKSVFNLPNINVIGIGTNLGCMMGIKPTYDKLIQLVLYGQLLEAKFKQNITLISGASSITLPLLEKDKVPSGINHFRIGEAAFLGTTPLNNKPILNLNTGTFTFEAYIVELYRRDSIPDGEITNAAIGKNIFTESESPSLEPSFKAVLDFGILDVDADNLIPEDKSVSFFGNSSDLSVYDLGTNPNGYKTGDVIRFELKYMAVAKLMYSQFVEKEIII